MILIKKKKYFPLQPQLVPYNNRDGENVADYRCQCYLNIKEDITWLQRLFDEI